MPIEIRLLEESEFNLANDLFNNTSRLNNPSPLPLRSYDKFCWEFLDCPYGKAIYAGVWEKEEGKEQVLVGTQCFILLKMITTEGKEIISAKGESTLIDMRTLIKYKNIDILKGLFDVLREECKNRGVDFMWGFNNIPASYKRLGYDNPFKSFHGLLVLKPRKAFKNIMLQKSNVGKLSRVKIGLGTFSLYILSLKKSFMFSRKNNYLFNNELNENDELFKKASLTDKMIFLLQNKNYLKWKISENPYDITYRSFQLVDTNGSLVAQAICNVQKEVAFIEQTLFDKKLNKDQKRSFLKKVLNALENENVGLVRFTGFNNNTLNVAEMDLLKSIGFVFTGKGEWFTFKNISSDPDIDPGKIYLSRMYKQGIN